MEGGGVEICKNCKRESGLISSDPQIKEGDVQFTKKP